MPDGITTNYELILPEIGGSNDSWGLKLNDNLVSIDTLLKAVNELAEGAAAVAALALPATSFTANEILTLIKTVDGADSGLDAALLGGKDKAWFEDIKARLGYDPLNKQGGTVGPLTIDGPLTLAGDPVDPLNAATKAFVERLVGSAGMSNREVLNAVKALDGAGSGLDADTVDGYQASAFARVRTFTDAQNGAIAFSNGFKMQWGRTTVLSNSYGTVTFPMAFSKYCAPVMGSSQGLGNGEAQDNTAMIYSVTLTNFAYWAAQDTNSNGWWIAAGV